MRLLMTTVAVTALLGGTVALAAPAAAATAVRCDFDGDGTADLAVGVPGEDGRGAVNVQYQRTGRLADPGILRQDWLPDGSAYGPRWSAATSTRTGSATSPSARRTRTAAAGSCSSTTAGPRRAWPATT